jgi:hypothetical protein
MTKKLEEIFDLPTSASDSDDLPDFGNLTVEDTKAIISTVDNTIDKIDAALAEVSDVDKSDAELDEIAALAKQSFTDLSDLGMQVDSRFASEIFNVASSMLGHALNAKTAKMNKKLKMIELQMKKLKLDRDLVSDEGPTETAQGQVLNRNDLLERLLSSRSQNNKSS